MKTNGKIKGSLIGYLEGTLGYRVNGDGSLSKINGSDVKDCHREAESLKLLLDDNSGYLDWHTTETSPEDGKPILIKRSFLRGGKEIEVVTQGVYYSQPTDVDCIIYSDYTMITYPDMTRHVDREDILAWKYLD